MNISRQEAESSLADITRTLNLTRRSIAAGCSAPLLILWGAIWFFGYSGAHFFPDRAGSIWAALIALGSTMSWVAGVRCQSPIKSPHDARIGIFWLILFAYAFVWLFLLAPPETWQGPGNPRPFRGNQISAFSATVPMFAYVAGGLWFGAFFIWLGGIVTALTLFGYVMLPAYFNLWMAVVGGGSLILAGLYIRAAWR